jgi:hypothetical protein
MFAQPSPLCNDSASHGEPVGTAPVIATLMEKPQLFNRIVAEFLLQP